MPALLRLKRSNGVGKTKRNKSYKIMAVVKRNSHPAAVKVSSTTPFETKLVASTLRQRFISENIKRLTGDRAYDSDSLDKEELKGKGIELNAPHKKN